LKPALVPFAPGIERDTDLPLARRSIMVSGNKLLGLGGAVLTATLLFGSPLAQACTTAAWSATVGAPVAGSRADQFPTIMGNCGMLTAEGGTSYVVSEHPQTDTTYRARFYVFTGATAAATVFQAYSDVGATTPVITVTYDPGTSSLSATVPGSTLANVTGIDPNRWYGVEVARIVGEPARFSVRGGGGGGLDGGGVPRLSLPKIDVTRVGTGNASGAGVEVARLGAIGATTGRVGVEEFESSRAPATEIGFLLRADANDSGTVDSGDIIATAREVVSPGSFTGYLDCNEDGRVDTGDISCVARIAVGL
jgi:hypothetical protein